MRSEHTMRILPASVEAWEAARRAIAEGKLAAFPTDTVYGVGCDPYNVDAISRLYEAKSRDRLKAIPLLLSDVAVVSRVASQVPAAARKLGEEFWPGALTLVLPRIGGLPEELGGGDTIAVRVPNHAGLQDFLRACGGALAVSSANLSGEPDAVDAQQAAAYLGERVEVIIDGGATRGGAPSTVVDCTKEPPIVLREGAISRAAIEQALREIWEA